MIGVLGDVMIDKYTYGVVERINPEAPVPIINVVTEKITLGGSGNVAKNIASLREKVTLFSVCNEKDPFGKQVINLCKKKNISFYFVTDGRPTIVKHRFIALGYNQQLLRVDYEKKHALPFKISKNLINKVTKAHLKVLIISDYNKGLITKELMEEIKKRFKGKILVDPKPNNIQFYKGVFLIKPNLKEASLIVGRKLKNENKDIEKAGLEIMREYHTNVAITRGSKGSTLITTNEKIYHIPTEVAKVHDVSGAGDTYISTLGYALSKKHDLLEAVKLANKASSIVVGKLGTATVSLNELFNDEK